MKIVRLSAENFKRLVAVDISPDGHVVEIRGRNGAGKSSVLDAIMAACAGADAVPSRPIRKGADQARISLDLGEIIVTRKFGPGDRTAVTVEAASGARFPSPQHVLDKLIGAIAFDPLEFVRMKPAVQLQTLRGLVTLAVDIDALDGQNKRDYDARAELNRDAAKLRGQASGIQFLDGLPADPIDVDALTRELARAGEVNADVTLRKERRAQAAQRVADLRAEAVSIDSGIEAEIAKLSADADGAARDFDRRIKDLERQLSDLRETRDEHLTACAEMLVRRRAEITDRATAARATANELQQRLDDSEPLPDQVDTGELIRQIDEVRQINAGIEARRRWETLEAEADALQKRSDALTEAMDDRRAQKVAAIAAAKMPVEGLAFGDGEVLFNDVPFDQASGAEQIRVSVAIAMAANPRLRVLCVRDGSLLDPDSMDALAAAVAEQDYQLWIERVGDGDGIGIIIEDGTVASSPTATPTVAAEAQANLI